MTHPSDKPKAKDSALTPYSRPVSFSERSFFGSPKPLEQDLSVQYVFEGRGRLSLADLNTAVTAAAVANPGARLVLRGHLKWLRWVAEGSSPRVTSLDSWDGTSELPSEVQKPFSLMTGPTCEVLLITAPKIRIVFRCFHGVMDGRGLLNFAEDVFRALRGEPCKGHPDTITDSELIEQLSPAQYRPMRPMKYRPLLECLPSHQTGVHGYRIGLDQHIPSLPAKMAAILIQVAQTRDETPISFMMPVDIRYYRPGIHSTGNLTAPIYFEGQARQDWESIQDRIMKALLEKEALRRERSERLIAWLPLWMTKLLIHSFEATQRRKGRYIFSTYISHINLPKRSTFSGGGFDCESAFVTPPPTEFFPLGITAITLEGKTQMTVFGPRRIVDDTSLQELAERIRAQLLEGTNQ